MTIRSYEEDKQLLMAAANLLGVPYREDCVYNGPSGYYLKVPRPNYHPDYTLWEPFADSSIALGIICKLSADLQVNQRTVALDCGPFKVIQPVVEGDKPQAVRLGALKLALLISRSGS